MKRTMTFFISLFLISIICITIMHAQIDWNMSKAGDINKILTVKEEEEVRDSDGMPVPRSFVSKLVVSIKVARVKSFIVDFLKNWFLE